MSQNTDFSLIEKQAQRNERIRKILTYVLLTFWALIVLFPFYWMILTSVKSYSVYNSEYIPKLYTLAPTLQNYHDAFTAVSLGRYFLNTLIFTLITYFLNTLIFTLITTALMMIVTVLAAFAFARLKFRGKDLLFTLFLSLMMIPNELVIITNFVTITNAGLRNTYTGLILPSVTSVFYIYLLKENFEQIPEELYKAAKVDGTSDFKYLWREHPGYDGRRRGHLHSADRALPHLPQEDHGRRFERRYQGMRTRKKILAVLLTAVLAVLSLTGCHGSRGRAAFAVPEQLDESAKIELTFWAKNDTNKTQTAIYEKAISDFEALYPNIHVNYGKIYNDVITNISTNTTPNVCITYPDHIATYMTGDNVVVPLDSLIDDARYGLAGSELKFDGPSKEEIVPQFLGECAIGGTTYALPYMRSTEACYVNKTLTATSQSTARRS